VPKNERYGNVAKSVVLWFKNACGALAAGEDDHGTGWAKSRGEAEDMALSNCNDHSTQFPS